jgi:hypothetical protein
MLRTKARLACARGPSVPSMFTGRPMTKAATPVPAGLRQQRLGVERELAAQDHRAGIGEAQALVGHRDADGLVAEVETGQRVAAGEHGRQVFHRNHGHGRSGPFFSVEPRSILPPIKCKENHP